MPYLLLFALVTLLGLSQGCVTTELPPQPPPSGRVHSQRIDHVVIIAVDGLKQDTLLSYLERPGERRKGGLHDLFGITSDGSGTMLTKGVAVQQAVTVFPSFTYPSWTSMFTGVYPGTHGITGNNLFFRDREIARYYTEYHLDSIRVQLDKDFLSNDINPHIKTLHEYVGSAGGQSMIVHNMVTRGGVARKPDFDTLWSYQRNHSHAVDENSLWEAVHSLSTSTKNSKEPGRILPSVFTVYFSGLDHVEHISQEGMGGGEGARIAYVDHLDHLISKFFAGDPAIARNHFPSPASEPVRTDPIAWQGIMNNPAWQRTMVVLVSDHGHTPVRWVDALGIDDLKLIFEELSENSGRAYHVEEPSLINETALSKIRALWGLVEEGQVSERANVVATLNGGTLGIHLKPRDGTWRDRPDYLQEVKPVLEHLLLTMHTNGYGPEAVLYQTGGRYVVIPYSLANAGIQLLPPQEVKDSLLNTAAFPMAAERLDGLVSSLPGDPSSAPDIVLLADRSKRLTYANKQEWRVIEGLKTENHRHFHSDHGHLRAAESVVPLLFVVGGTPTSQPHLTVCHASLVDVTPTILDVLGILEPFERAMAARPSTLRGHSLKNSLELIMDGHAKDHTLCPSSIPWTGQSPGTVPRL